MIDLVSIIVPVYNCENYLHRCLDSLINQTYNNIEIVLVDDGSTDSSLDICNEFKLMNSNVFVISQINGGPSKARNTGLENCSGKWIMFVDSDDYIDNDTVEKLVLSVDKDDVLIGCKHKIVINGNSLRKTYPKDIYGTEEYLNCIFSNKTLGTVWGYLYDAKYAKSIKFDTKTKCCEDTIYFVEYLKKSNIKSIKFVSNTFYYYVYNSSSITKNSEKYFERCKNYFYSLNVINEMTNNHYAKQVNNSKIRILEAQLFNVEAVQYKKFFEELNIEHYYGYSIRYILFSFIYIKKCERMLNLYYKFLRLKINLKKTLKDLVKF